MTTKFDIIKLKFLAAMGDVEAMYTLATNYLYGIGVEADLERAHSYLEKAVDKGFEPAKGMIETVFATEANLQTSFLSLKKIFMKPLKPCVKMRIREFLLLYI